MPTACGTRPERRGARPVAETSRSARARLAYFEFWTDPVALQILGRDDGIDVRRLEYAAAEADNWREMERAHGYQIATRGELVPPWFGDDALIARCPGLLAICSTGSGFDIVDVDACTRAGIIVCNQGGANREAVAEHALALIISLSKKIALADRMLRRGHVDRYAIDGRNVQGKTVGLVGIGHIGTRVAQLCGGLLGMRVLACDPYLTEQEIAARGATKATLDEVLAGADFVSVHCPRNAETEGMFGRAQFAHMKPTAYFVNTARGGIYDEEALAEALAQRRIAGAGLDVFLVEPPPPQHPLLAFDNVIVTPHSAGMSRESLQTMASYAAEQWLTILSGGVPPRLINPSAWGRYSLRFERAFGFAPAPLEPAPAAAG